MLHMCIRSKSLFCQTSNLTMVKPLANDIKIISLHLLELHKSEIYIKSAKYYYLLFFAINLDTKNITPYRRKL